MVGETTSRPEPPAHPGASSRAPRLCGAAAQRALEPRRTAPAEKQRPQESGRSAWNIRRGVEKRGRK